MGVLAFFPTANTYTVNKTTLLTPANAYVDDTLDTIFQVGARGGWTDVIYSGFDFSAIPSNVTIDLVRLQLCWMADYTDVPFTISIQARKNGVNVGSPALNTSLSTPYPLIQSILPNDLTGTWSRAELDSLSVRIYVQNAARATGYGRWDYVKVIVYYTEFNIVHATVTSVLSTGTIQFDMPVLNAISNVIFCPPILLLDALSIAPVLVQQRNIIIQHNTSNIFTQANNPLLLFGRGVYINIPILDVSTLIFTPILQIQSKLMTIDSLHNLRLIGEVIEGVTINLNRLGVLTVVEIVEGAYCDLSSTGVLTVNTFREGDL